MVVAALDTLLEERTLRDVLDIKEEERRNMSDAKVRFVLSNFKSNGDLQLILGEKALLFVSLLHSTFQCTSITDKKIKSIKSVDVGVRIIIVVSCIFDVSTSFLCD